MAEESAVSDAAGRGEAAGRLIGAAVFAAGVALLCLVFTWAYQVFVKAAGYGAGRGGDPGGQADVAMFALGTGARILLLVVMGHVASLIATKGIELYRACARRGQR